MVIQSPSKAKMVDNESCSQLVKQVGQSPLLPEILVSGSGKAVQKSGKLIGGMIGVSILKLEDEASRSNKVHRINVDSIGRRDRNKTNDDGKILLANSSSHSLNGTNKVAANCMMTDPSGCKFRKSSDLGANGSAGH
ncbi:hypothetical protein Ancab_007785 [Ancistrocladus abbreviatus]